MVVVVAPIMGECGACQHGAGLAAAVAAMKMGDGMVMAMAAPRTTTTMVMLRVAVGYTGKGTVIDAAEGGGSAATAGDGTVVPDEGMH